MSRRGRVARPCLAAARAVRVLAVGGGVALLLAAPLGQAPPRGLGTLDALAQGDGIAIVYSRCLRTEKSLSLSGSVTVGGVTRTATRILEHTDVVDVLPDVTHFYDGFTAPCDLVLRESDGRERVLYDCARRSTDGAACAALDAAVSFDARTVAFAVFRGPIKRKSMTYPPQLLDLAATNRNPLTVLLPNAYLQATEAQLYRVDVGSGAVTPLPHAVGIFDSGPAWLSNGRLAFTSTRSGQHSTMVTAGQRPASQIFTMDPDGRNVEKASHHALAGEQHPLQLADGRVAFSSWQIFGMLPYRSDNGTPGAPGTIPNFFHVFAQHPDGANLFAVYGQHLSGPGKDANAHPPHLAAHFIGQTSDGRLWVSDYYRGNNLGMGRIVGFPLPPLGQEGIGPDDQPHHGDIFRPRGFVNLAPWTTGQDMFSPPMPAPAMRIPTFRDPLAYAGKLSHPAGLPGNGLMLTWGVGPCGEVSDGRLVGGARITNGSGGFPAMNALTLLGRDNPGCDAGIYRAAQIPLRHPSDLVEIVNRREYHEIMARALVPYSAIHGRPAPVLIPRAEVAAAGDRDLPPGSPYGILGASSIVLRETRSILGDPFSARVPHWTLQGTDAVDYGDDELCGVRILIVQPNQAGEARRFKTTVGERVGILGEFPVRKTAAGGGPRLDPTGAPDTSFKVRFPANTPYLMQGIDCQGRTLNTDQTWQHLRPGEVKTCNGCHVHGKEGLPFDKTAAGSPDYRPIRLGEGTVPLLAGGSGATVEVRPRPGWALFVEWQRDVFPILQRRCASCHAGASAAAGLVLDAPGTGPGSSYHRLVKDRKQEYVPAALRYRHPFHKPQLTKYVRALNSRGSLLYWKAVNRRTDGRTDDQYGPASPRGWEDVDFGPPHPTGMTPEESGTLARWLDTGAGAEAGYLLDTTPPALHLSARVEKGALTALLVGTVDAPSGIDPGSLHVCVVRPNGVCGPNLAGRASAAGVVIVALRPPLSDPRAEIRARVRDLAGNVTEEQRTVGWFLDHPAGPNPPRAATR